MARGIDSDDTAAYLWEGFGMELEEMITRQRILDALASYCRALDRMDEEIFDGLWHAEAVIDYAGLYRGDAV
ncbi:MAG: nuclear transport factor 2 family protein, partial [Candidatus Binatia bacterium]|nr:nuclear transport factor 2 family protein [Candidatus Binatia bacterium]